MGSGKAITININLIFVATSLHKASFSRGSTSLVGGVRFKYSFFNAVLDDKVTNDISGQQQRICLRLIEHLDD